jgi:uncharacterized membrane protein
VASLLRGRLHDVLRGLWFVPGVVTAGFAGLALLLVRIDRTAGTDGVDIAFGGSASAARTILSTVAASVITVAGLAFSLTIITLQLVSQQFSPRATRTFLGDRPTQISAGVFLGVFVYCLLVLRAVREEEFGEFVPGLAVTMAIALGAAGIAVLLFFIHNTARSIEVTSIAARIAGETLAAIDVLYPAPYGRPVPDGDEEEPVPTVPGDRCRQVFPDRAGYVRHVDVDSLVRGLPDWVERVDVHPAPGEFVTESRPLATTRPAGPREDGALERRVRAAVPVGRERDVRDDAVYGFQQLADIALRALSPGLNDSTTAVTCADYISACLERLCGRAFPSALRRYPDAGVEVAVRRPRFGDFLRVLRDVGRSAPHEPRVVAALLRGAARAAAVASEGGAGDRAAALLDVAEQIAAPAIEEARAPDDRAVIETALAEVRRASRAAAP